MPDARKVKVEKPVSVLNRKLKPDSKPLFAAIAKGVLKGASFDWSGVVDSAIDASAALGLKNEPEQMAWLLIQRALGQTVVKLVQEQASKFSNDIVNIDELSAEIDWSMAHQEITIDENFFRNPKEVPIVAEMASVLDQWLQNAGLNPGQAVSVSKRFKSYFISALNDEWAARPDEYACLKAVKTPLTQAKKEDQAWNRYHARLDKQLDVPMFEEAFGLRQVHVDLRAYWSEETDKKSDEKEISHLAEKYEETRHVNLLKDELGTWLDKGNKDDAIRVISGGPGSGKSSAVQVFAAEEAAKGERKVLLIPLHRLNAQAKLVESVTEFMTEDIDLKQAINPMQPTNDKSPPLIIFDGLDELTGNDPTGQTMAKTFAGRVAQKASSLNTDATQVMVIISGRDIPIQEAQSLFIDVGKVLHLLPYYIKEEPVEKYTWTGQEELLKLDQRHQWWKAYGEAIGQNFPKMPNKFDHERLTDITAQPLLNYLMALSDAGDLEVTENTNLNEIYAELFRQVYDRVWAKPDQDKPRKTDLSKDEYEKCLEQIALAMWHRQGRSATTKEIKSKLSESNLEKFINGLKETDNGLARLMTTFFFRKSSQATASHESFEFTHKSFGEYLIARRIVRAIEEIHQGLELKMGGSPHGWDVATSLGQWIDICGPGKMDFYILPFLRDEVALRHAKTSAADAAGVVMTWQKSLASLFSSILINGTPVEKANGERIPFPTEQRWANNAGETLLTALNACVRVTNQTPQWTGEIPPTAFGAWLSMVQGQPASYYQIFLINNCLNKLNLSNFVMVNAYLIGANLRGADLREADLRGADLRGADLREAYLIEADFRGADLREAYLIEADLREADLRKANLREAYLIGADLIGADLREANLIEADLSGANLIGANLMGAHLNGADLRGAKLRGAKMTKEQRQYALHLGAIVDD